MDNELRVHRAKRRLNQRKTALAAGMSYDRYMRIENGYTEPTPEECDALAAVFGVKRSAVFPKPRQTSTAA